MAIRGCAAGPDPEAAAIALRPESLRGFGPVGILAFLLILAGNLLFVPLSALLVLAWARLSDTPWSELGFSPPASWWRTVAIGIGLGVALKLIMKAIVMPLLGAPPTNEAYRFLVGNAAALPAVLYLVIVGAGFGEETLFRGYLFERLGKLFRRGLWTKALIVFLTAAFFGVVHYPEQGMPGVHQALLVGLVFGTIYAFTQRLWMLMVAHAAFDLTAVTIIYFGWERAVAEFFTSAPRS